MIKKSVYHRKYHLNNIINQICDKNELHISTSNLIKIHQIFQDIDKITTSD